MLQYIIREQRLFLTLLLWMVIGMASSMAAMIFIPLHLISMRNKGMYLLFLLGLWFLFTLSDSRQFAFRFAQNIKPVIFLATAFLIWEERNSWPQTSFYKSFLPFFGLAIISWFESPIQMLSLQKMFSYFLLVYTIPMIIQRLLIQDKQRFLKGLIALGLLVLLAGLTLRVVIPGFVVFGGERFSGLLGNPNGLGIYAFCFLMLYILIRHYHKHYFSQFEHYLILAAIIISLIFAGSRGGIFSSLLFLVAYYMFQRSIVLGFIVLISVYIGYQVVMTNAVDIITSLGLEDYFRLETLEKGSGRLVAFEFARKHIQYNYWWGKGFGYTEHLMHQWADYFVQKGHQGNVHNSYLTIWLNVGLIGLIAFCWGWLKNIYQAAQFSPLAWAVLFGIALTTTVESWLSASMNPFTIQLVIILSLLSMKEFYKTPIASNTQES